MSAELPWIIGGTVLSGAVLAYMLYSEEIAPGLRRKKRLKQLRSPAEAFFIVLPSEQAPITFAVQERVEAHLIEELVLPANSEHDVAIQIHPTTDFNSVQMLFVTDGDADQKPYAMSYANPFVRSGRKSISPDTDHNHTLTTSYNYQMIKNEAWSIGNVKICGFKIKTRDPGEFPAKLAFVGEPVEGLTQAALKIRVVPEVSKYMYMRCVNPEHKPSCIVRLLQSQNQ